MGYSFCLPLRPPCLAQYMVYGKIRMTDCVTKKMQNSACTLRYREAPPRRTQERLDDPLSLVAKVHPSIHPKEHVYILGRACRLYAGCGITRANTLQCTKAAAVAWHGMAWHAPEALFSTQLRSCSIRPPSSPIYRLTVCLP